MNVKLFMILLGLALSIGGIFLGIKAISAYQNARSSSSWPSIAGAVIRSEVAKSSFRSRRGGRISYQPVITYTYTVDGISYKSNRIKFGKTSSSFITSVQKIIDRYPFGSTVTVYYKPSNPNTSVLVPGFFSSFYFGFIVSIGILLAGIYVLWLGLYKNWGKGKVRTN